MKLIKVAAAVLNQTPLDWAGNTARIKTALQEAKDQKVSILCLPELCITGYGCEDAFLAPGTHRMAWRVLLELIPETSGLIVSFGLPILFQNAVFNVACLAANGRLLGFVAKRFLAGDGIHYEPRWFKPWPQDVKSQISAEGVSYPIGDIFFDCGGIKLGFEICEDAWVANRPGTQLASRGVDFILNPSASHFAFGKIEIRKRFVLEGSRAFGCGYIYSNLLGNESGRSIYDGGALIATGGRLAAVGPRFSYQDVILTTAVIDVEANRMSQSRLASFHPGLTQPFETCIAAEFDYPLLEPTPITAAPQEWESSLYIKEEEFARAIALALFDYLRKSRSGGFVVSLSGGADSSAVSCLVALAIHFGIKEIGAEEFWRKLSYLSFSKTGTADTRAAIQSLLTCVYQSTRNSSETTHHAAKSLAQAIGAAFIEWDVDDLVERYISTVSTAINRTLNWSEDDIALQNIQARTRSPGIWLLANLRNALLLSTSNRSEAAVGYATMDGDTSGGLCPVGGIDKAFLIQWLRWLEDRGPAGLHPIPALSAVNRQSPTAELRPQDRNQTDEEDLMPYSVLDAIERAAIRDKQSPSEIFMVLRAQFTEHPEAKLCLWIRRFFQLWCRNQWKRERYAPSFHVDDENLDPKTWCRFPILSGGYQRELEEMEKNHCS